MRKKSKKILAAALAAILNMEYMRMAAAGIGGRFAASDRGGNGSR